MRERVTLTNNAVYQRGGLLIAAVIMIVVISFLGSVVTVLFVGNQQAGSDFGSSTQAIMLAEAGVERGTREWKLAPSSYTGEGPLSLGNGNFSVQTFDTDLDEVTPLLPTQKRIRGIGMVSSAGGVAMRTMDRIVEAGTGFNFTEPFPDLANWPGSGPNATRFCPPSPITAVLATDGSVGQTAADNAPGSTDGAFYAETTAASGARLTGYREHTLSTTLAAGSNITLDLWYKKVQVTGGSKPIAMDVAVDVVATDNTVYRLWADCSKNPSGWAVAPTVSWTIPAGATIDRLRIAYDIENATSKGKNPKVVGPNSIRVDQIVLTSP